MTYFSDSLYKIALFILLIFLCSNVHGQNKKLIAVKDNSMNRVVFSEGQRVRLLTINEKKIPGKLLAISNESVIIKNLTIPIDEIIKIEKNPLVLSVLTGGTMILTGITLFNAGLIGAVFVGDTSALLAVIPSIGLIYGGLKFPNILRACKVNKKWTLSVIE